MPVPSPPLSRSFRRLLGASGAVFAVSLAFVLLDVGADVRLPASIRVTLPWLLVGSALVGITLLVGALGTPTRSKEEG